jgi:CRP-like cAMP-binding protein
MATIDIFKHEDSTHSFASGHIIFEEGESGDVAYVIQEGEVEISVSGKVFETVGVGGLIGEMALLDTTPRSATAVATADCKMVGLDQKKFLYHVRLTPFFAIQVMRLMAERLRHMDEKV